MLINVNHLRKDIKEITNYFIVNILYEANTTRTY
jgi:hypothetical protein